MKLLLHACCGPCSLEPVRLLRTAGHDVTIYYANSNIAPAAEYARRLGTLRTWACSEGVPVTEGAYEPAAWEATVGRIGEAALDEARERLRANASGQEDVRTDAGWQTLLRTNISDQARPQTDANGPEELRTNAGGQPALPLAIDPARREARCRACYRLRFQEAAREAAARGFAALGTTLSVSPYQYTNIIREELERAAAEAGMATLFEDYRPYYEQATRRSRALGMYRQNYCGCRFSEAEAAAERAERKQARVAAREAESATRAEERAAAEAARQAHRAEKAAYAAKQAHKHAILKQLRMQQKDSHENE